VCFRSDTPIDWSPYPAGNRCHRTGCRPTEGRRRLTFIWSLPGANRLHCEPVFPAGGEKRAVSLDAPIRGLQRKSTAFRKRAGADVGRESGPGHGAPSGRRIRAERLGAAVPGRRSEKPARRRRPRQRAGPAGADLSVGWRRFPRDDPRSNVSDQPGTGERCSNPKRPTSSSRCSAPPR
jgi:hypothetical protein